VRVTDRFASEMEKNGDEEKVVPYFLDLIAYPRKLSKLVAQEFGVPHESPQVIVIKNEMRLR